MSGLFSMGGYVPKLACEAKNVIGSIAGVPSLFNAWMSIPAVGRIASHVCSVELKNSMDSANNSCGCKGTLQCWKERERKAISLIFEPINDLSFFVCRSTLLRMVYLRATTVRSTVLRYG